MLCIKYNCNHIRGEIKIQLFSRYNHSSISVNVIREDKTDRAISWDGRDGFYRQTKEIEYGSA